MEACLTSTVFDALTFAVGVVVRVTMIHVGVFVGDQLAMASPKAILGRPGSALAVIDESDWVGDQLRLSWFRYLK